MRIGGASWATVVAWLAGVAVLSMGSGSGSRVLAQEPASRNSLFGETVEAPCFAADSESEFTATGFAHGSSTRLDELQINALSNAQAIVAQKMSHVYQAVIEDYGLSMGNDGGTDIVNKLERAGNHVINAILNDTKAWCQKFTSPDDKGNVQCITGIRIDKNRLARAIAEEVAQDEELSVRVNEENFRKRMEKYFKDPNAKPEPQPASASELEAE